MQREYLEEDLAMVRRYFPGAKETTLSTPFDLTPHTTGRPRLREDTFHDTTKGAGWLKEALWTSWT